MPNTFSDPQVDPMDTDSIPLLPADLWSVPYFQMPGILAAATLVDPVRVGEIFSASAPVVSAPTQSAVIPSTTPALFRPSPPPITQYNGSSATLCPFCSQLMNQIQGLGIYFPDENAKVHFAYQCLGPGALEKMRSSFRCLEDPSVPVEIKTLDQFITALKQSCQDPSLRHQATTKIDGLRQNNMKFVTNSGNQLKLDVYDVVELISDSMEMCTSSKVLALNTSIPIGCALF
ncbi:hypothetical protein K3495_g15080 [Podosphaera aphanis]|nr:hypothetical protein K3495_g15080 [Podosphaera aphanis]